MGDKKLADLFTPYGTVIYSKVGVEKDTGRNRTYGTNPSCLAFSRFSLVLHLNTILFPLLSTFTFETLYFKCLYIISQLGMLVDFCFTRVLNIRIILNLFD